MTLFRLKQLQSLLSQDDDIAKLTITSGELSEIFQYEQKLISLWAKNYTTLEVINTMIRDRETER